MTLNDLHILLKQTNLPVTYHSFKASGDDVPDPPYIIYFFANSNNFSADNRVYIKRNNCHVELYTNLKDSLLEKTLEDIFDEAEIFYDKTETYIDDELMYQILYEIEI